MSNEATIRGSLQIVADNVRHISQPGQFTADVTGRFGPSPGAIPIATGAGTDVSLANFTTAAFCELKNLDSTNYVEYGIKAGGTFYPLGILRPGRGFVLELSPNILFGSSGTAATQTFHMRADTAACKVFVGAFER